MIRKTFCGIMLTLLLTSMFTLAFVCAATTLHFVALGLYPSVHGNIIAFQTDYWSDKISYYNISSGVLTHTGISGSWPDIYDDIIAFSTYENRINEDLNQDGDMLDKVIRYYNMSSETVTNTGAGGSYPKIYKNIISFVYRPPLPAPQEVTLGYYNISSETTVYLSQGNRFSVYEDIIAYCGIDDLEIYNITSGTVVHTGVGTHNIWCAEIFGNTIAVTISEVPVGGGDPREDLNRDGDYDDHFLGYFNITDGMFVDTQIEAGYVARYISNDIIFFDPPMDHENWGIGYYEPSSKKVTYTAIWGYGTAAYGNTVAFEASGVIYYFSIPSPPTATIDIDPDTLNLRSAGKWITAYIQLPEGYNPEDIDAATILLNDTISPVLDPKYDFVTNSSEYLVDHNNDGILERMVKFDRAAVQSFIYDLGIRNDDVALAIAGKLFDDTEFEGTDTITVIINAPFKR